MLLASAAMTGCASNVADDSVPQPASSTASPVTTGDAAEAETSPSESTDSTDSGNDYQAPTAKPSPTKSKTSRPKPTDEVDEPQPLFVTSLPDTVNAEPGQNIIVQLGTDSETRWKATVSGTASVSAVSYSGPPGEQPGAPGVSIANVTAPQAGTAYVNFMLVPKDGGATIDTARLEIIVS